jgi:3-methyl-2-oxobutanoate hydroxymethyltransferase
MLEEAVELQNAGVFSIVLEAIPQVVAQVATKVLSIPTIGIGAGLDCDGQVLVFHDALGLSFGHKPKFVRRYANLAEESVKAIERYVQDVKMRQFPSAEETYQVNQAEFSDFTF